MIEVEEPEPESFGYCRVATDSVVLIRNPHDQDDVEGCCRVLKELGHNGFHTLGKV